MSRTTTTIRTARTTRLAALATTALLAVGLAGCGSDDETQSASDPGASASVPSAAPAGSSPATSAPAGGSDASTGALPAWAPKIITDGDDVTGLDFTGTPPPSDQLLVAQVTTGDGPPVESGQTITADYFGQLPDATEPFDESFSGEPFMAPVGVGSLIQGWDQGLVGVPVGSRVVMSVPPDLGYGDSGSGPIPGGATLFFVIDIIAAS